MQKEKQVILVNIHDIKTNERIKYKQLLKKVLNYQPKSIGVDVTFSKTQVNDLEEFNNNDRIIFAKGGENDFSFINSGSVDFPKIDHHEQRTIRYYDNSSNSFAAKLVSVANENHIQKNADDHKFLLHYNAINNGVSHLINDNQEKNLNYTTDFWYLNSNEVIQDSLNLYEDYFKNKIVIIGYLGDRSHFNAQYDIEDKFRIPADTKHFINKEPIMNGAVIHGVAVSNILNPEFQFSIFPSGLLLFVQLVICSIFLILLLFYDFGKLLNRILLFLLSIPLLFSVLYLMDQMIFLKLGGTLFTLLIIEEMFEILEPFEHKYLTKYLNHD
jgi:CHASE2 domain-containing sensor protein